MLQVYFIPFLLPFLVPVLYYYLSVKKVNDKTEAYKRLFHLSIITAVLVSFSHVVGVYSVQVQLTGLKLLAGLIELCAPVGYILAILFLAWKSKNPKLRRVYIFNMIISIVVIVSGWIVMFLFFSMSHM